MGYLHILLVLTCILSSAFADPVSNDFIENINKQNLTWRARKYSDTSSRRLSISRTSLGLSPTDEKDSLNIVAYQIADGDIPESFDAREKWSNCSSLKEIRDQANCGSCWAFAATEAMTDRICIHSNGIKQISVSAQDLLSCCTNCGYGCNGGYPANAWSYWHKTGIVSGGLYNSSNGCRSYSLAPCDHHVSGSLTNCSAVIEAETPQCVKTCDNGTHLNYTTELTFGEVPYVLENVTSSIQWEILTNGPVEAEFDVYEDFLVYSEGVYKKTENVSKVGAHDVKIIGWGVDGGIPYWLIANSWNAEWGENGYFRMLRGENHCGIESYVVVAVPNLGSDSNIPKFEIGMLLFSWILYMYCR
ncbi:hypothetical protein NQ317_012390 [Molorchus minor]|uniref:Peptidase C1A papain C-terminal domain-containing protein n=1 Tax=Molorchus minor TaxID=1323400 RepID=A0ABQ9IRN9_9CUCU|nr:hypothetical protein NQ317_012390 [Molorchus minor]